MAVEQGKWLKPTLKEHLKKAFGFKKVEISVTTKGDDIYVSNLKMFLYEACETKDDEKDLRKKAWNIIRNIITEIINGKKSSFSYEMVNYGSGEISPASKEAQCDIEKREEAAREREASWAAQQRRIQEINDARSLDIAKVIGRSNKRARTTPDNNNEERTTAVREAMKSAIESQVAAFLASFPFRDEIIQEIQQACESKISKLPSSLFQLNMAHYSIENIYPKLFQAIGGLFWIQPRQGVELVESLYNTGHDIAEKTKKKGKEVTFIRDDEEVLRCFEQFFDPTKDGQVQESSGSKKRKRELE